MKSNTIQHAFAASAIILAMLFGSPAHAEGPSFDNIRTPEPPPGANVAAAFFVVNNTSDEDLVLTAAESSAAENTELHLTSVVDDVARMEEQAEIVIPAGESLEFKHGSYHVMLIGLIDSLTAGDEYSLTLTSSAGDIELTVPVVKSMGMGKPAMNKGHDMQDSDMQGNGEMPPAEPDDMKMQDSN
ncbi:MAG: hypothetical protein CSB44_06765 [Gammaproteobacteria bacterium]|nr:MAG: hypothetical protein CSB44_06765 [Gammaproteobacteria bacterium]